MSKPWNFKVDDNRTSDNLFTFNIFCEGRNSEPIYFSWFETSEIKIITHGEQKSMCKNVNKTLTKCLDDGILKKLENGQYDFYEEGMEIWCVFDRDKNPQETSLDEGDVDFSSAMTIADSSPIKVAWSNDSFDLWILLHLEDVTNDLESAKNRTYYFERLTNYFKNHSAPNELLQKTLAHPSFSYEKDLKQEKKIKEIILPEIIPNTTIAIERAKRLLNIHVHETDISKKMPCTTVFQLIERLLEAGGKSVNIFA